MKEILSDTSNKKDYT